MIDAVNLLWIIPLSALFGFLLAALMYSAADDEKEKKHEQNDKMG